MSFSRKLSIALCCLLPFVGMAQKKSKLKAAGYLFVYFTGNSVADESIHYAISKDAFHWKALNLNHPVLDSKEISSTGGVRDPHILRGADGKTFYMVATDMKSSLGWNSNRAMVLMKSKDLIHWNSSIINIQKQYPHQDRLLRVWAPQTIYDDSARKYMVYFSMKHGDQPDIIYYAYANKDFSALESYPKQLLFNPEHQSCIDGDMVKKDGQYHLFFKTESGGPKGIKTATSSSLTHGFTVGNRYVQPTTEAVEGACVFPLINGKDWILMYDMYMKGSYQFTISHDLQHFEIVDQQVSMDFHPRHGTVIQISKKEMKRLQKTYGTVVFP